MGHVIKANDFAATIIVFAEYDLGASIAQVLDAHRLWHIDTECSFANNETELESSLMMLILHALGDKSESKLFQTKINSNDWERAQQLKLIQIIPFCLDMAFLSLSDSHTIWTTQNIDSKQFPLMYREFKNAILQVIKKNQFIKQDVKNILLSLGYENDIIYKYTCYQDKYYERHPDQKSAENFDMPYPSFYYD